MLRSGSHAEFLKNITEELMALGTESTEGPSTVWDKEMPEDNATVSSNPPTSVMEEGLQNVRQQKLEQQRKLLEKKQRRKRLEPIMIKTNPDYKLKPRRSRKVEEQEQPVKTSGVSNIFTGVSEDLLASPCLSTIVSKDNYSRNIKAVSELDKREAAFHEAISDDELEETILEDTSPLTIKKKPAPARSKQKKIKRKDGSVPDTAQSIPQETDSSKMSAFNDSSEEENSVSIGNRVVPPAPVKQRNKKKTQKLENLRINSYYESGDGDEVEENDYEDILSSVGYTRPLSPFDKEEDSQIATPMEIDDLKDFALRPAPHNMNLKCRITRDKSGIEKGIYPTYYLHLERDDGKRLFLMAGRKRKKSKASNYLISVDPTDLSRGGESYIAKIRSNLLGTRFTVFDNGVNPESKPFIQEREVIRQELASISYKDNVFGLRGPRKMKVIIPGLNQDGERVRIQPLDEQETLLSRYQNGNTKDIIHLQNKVPSWNEETQSHVLNFHGRVTQASVKNFQIINGNDPENIIMQFGRVADDVFTMDFQHPLCALQAFGVCLSSFDGKLVCE